MRWTKTRIVYSYVHTLNEAIRSAGKLYPNSFTRTFKAKDGYHVWCDEKSERTILTKKVDILERKHHHTRNKTEWFIEGTWHRAVRGEGKWWNYDVSWNDVVYNVWQ